MKRTLSAVLCVVLAVVLFAFAASAEEKTVQVTSPDGLVTIDLPNSTWYQLITDEHTEMFSDGDCSIMIDMYKIDDKLPAIQVADENHEMIYTAAVSTREYVMLVVGYAHSRDDFSTMVKSINTIVLNIDKVDEKATDHQVKPDEYSIRETWYTAWVSAERLNVRSGSGTENPILTSLAHNDKVTVTGTVLKNGVDIGWSAVTLANGTKGYVSTQFLTTKEPAPAGSTLTGATRVMYTALGTPVTLYQYADGTWKTNAGICYWNNNDGTWLSDYRDTLFEKDPTAAAYRTGLSQTLYSGNGSVVIIYEYSNGTWMDDSYQNYVRYGAGQWQCSNTGEVLDTEPRTAPTPTGNTTTVYDNFGYVYYLYEYSDGSWRLNGVTFDHSVEFAWYGSDGSVLYVYDPSTESVPNPEDSLPSWTGENVDVYNSIGTMLPLFYFTDGSWRESTTASLGDVTYYKESMSVFVGTDGTYLYLDNPVGVQ